MFSIRLSTSSRFLSDLESVMSDEYYDNNTLALIGAIIVVWASIEKQVAGAVRWIEVGLAQEAKQKYANYTDLTKFRSFKERKGHLRMLVEKHGTNDELKSLDKVYGKLVKPNRVRHSLCHDLIHPQSDGNIYITKFGNAAKGEGIDTVLTTISSLEDTLNDIKPLTRSITAIGHAIYRRLDPSSK